jgi:hypothetical protein
MKTPARWQESLNVAHHFRCSLSYNVIPEERNTQRSEIIMATDVEKIHNLDSAPLKEVAKLARLPANWDGYGSPPVTEHAVRTAIDLLRAVEGGAVPAPHVCPVTGGGLGILWQASARRLEIEIVPDGSVEYAALTREGGEEHAIEEGSVAVSRSEEACHLVKRLIDWLICA